MVKRREVDGIRVSIAGFAPPLDRTAMRFDCGECRANEGADPVVSLARIGRQDRWRRSRQRAAKDAERHRVMFPRRRPGMASRYENPAPRAQPPRTAMEIRQ